MGSFKKMLASSLVSLFLLASSKATEESPLVVIEEIVSLGPDSQDSKVNKASFNIQPGDLLVLDIDQTILHTARGKKKYKRIPIILEPRLPGLIKKWESQGVTIIALTARHHNFRDETKQQLAQAGFTFSTILHAPNKVSNKGSSIPQKGQKLLRYLQGLQNLPQRVIVIDDLPQNLHDIETVLRQAPQIAALPRLLFLKQEVSFEVMGHLAGGSSGVYVLKDEKDQKWTFKCVAHSDHMKEEIVADALYQAVSVPVPSFRIYYHIPTSLQNQLPKCKGPGPYRLSRFIESGKATTAQLKNKMQKHFVADAFFSNWDIVVGNFKNVIMDQQGTLWRVDNGGSLRYRAVGERKQESPTWRAHQVLELKTLRDATTNKDGTDIYRHVSEQEIATQAHALLKKSPQLFAMLDQVAMAVMLDKPEEVRAMLRTRLDDLAKQYPIKERSSLAATVVPHVKAAAGILVYSIDPQTNRPVILLGQRIRHKWWGNLGGKSDVDPKEGHMDQTLAATAVREVKEESMGLFIFTQKELARLPSHDLEKEDGMLYRMYIGFYPYIDAQTFNNKLQAEAGEHQKEYRQFRWIPVADIIAALKNRDAIIFAEEQKTIKIDDIILHAPLYRMLQASPVQEALRKIRDKQPLPPRHTRGNGGEATIKWEPVDPSQSLAKVPFGTNAAGQVVIKRNVAGITEDVYQDAQAAQQQFADAVVNKSKVLADLQTSQHKEDLKPLLDIGKYTQSEAYLKLVLGKAFESNKNNPEKLIRTYFSSADIPKRLLRLSPDNPKEREFLKTLTQALKQERTMAGWYVFYHATQDMMGFLYDVFSAYRKRLQAQLPNSNPTLRALESAFMGINNVEDLIAYFQNQKEKIDNYDIKGGKSYQDVGLSVNPFLFGSEGSKTSSSIYLFKNNSSIDPPDYQKLFEAFAFALGIKRDWEDFIGLFEQYQKGNSRLYQIFIHPDIVDEVAYTAIPGGDLWKMKDTATGMLTTKISPAFSILRDRPEEFLELLAMGENKKHKSKLYNLQARLFLKPQYFHNRNIVQIKEYHRQKIDKANKAAYESRLEAIVEEDLSQWLQQHKIMSKGLILREEPNTTKPEREMPVLQEQYKAGYETSTGLTYQATKGKSLSLASLIDSGNIEGLKDYFKKHPNIDLNIPLKGDSDVYNKHTRPLPPILRALKRKALNILKIIDILVSNGASLAVKDENGATLLHYAASFAPADLIYILLKDEETRDLLLAQENLINKNGMTALHYAALNGSLETIKVLLKDKAARAVFLQPDNLKDQLGMTPLHGAAVRGHSSIIKVLLDNPVARMVLLKQEILKDQFGMTPLHSAASYGKAKVISLLLKDEEVRDLLHNPENIKDNKLMTPLHHAVSSGEVACIQALLNDQETRALLLKQTNLRDSKGATPLHYAARDQNTEILEALLGDQEVRNILLKAENLKDKNGNTPLHIAAFFDNTAIVEVLMNDKEARDILLSEENMYNKTFRTPQDLARLKGNKNSLDLIVNALKKEDHTNLCCVIS